MTQQELDQLQAKTLEQFKPGKLLFGGVIARLQNNVTKDGE